MSILDCESFESTLISAGRILKIEPRILLRSLKEFGFETLSEEEQRERPFWDWLVIKSVGQEPRELPLPSSIYWYHATRAVPTTTFSEGILPLSMNLKRIWDFLLELAGDWITIEEWEEFKKNMKGNGGYRYNLKLNHGEIQEGPFAFLVRDGIFRSEEAGNHDYLYMPEIVEDICGSFMETYGYPLHERFLAETRPCIVKFLSNLAAPGALPAALTYLHRAVRGEKLILECNTCYSGEGTIINPEAIHKVEWI